MLTDTGDHQTNISPHQGATNASRFAAARELASPGDSDANHRGPADANGLSALHRPIDAIRVDGSINAGRFDTAADDVFGRIASRYDLLSDLFSLWIHRSWKRRVAALIASEPWSKLLDAASGTGDIVLRVLNHPNACPSRKIVASDISPQMLAMAKLRLERVSQRVELQLLDAHSMPEIPADSVDLYSISLGLKICDRVAVLREALRVLKPGGRLVVLEASNIKPQWLHQTYLTYMSLVMPLIGWLATGGDASAYRYLLRGVREFPTAERLAAEIRQLGFDEVSFERLSLGIVAIHLARKPRLVSL